MTSLRQSHQGPHPPNDEPWNAPSIHPQGERGRREGTERTMSWARRGARGICRAPTPDQAAMANRAPRRPRHPRHPRREPATRPPPAAIRAGRRLRLATVGGHARDGSPVVLRGARVDGDRPQRRRGHGWRCQLYRGRSGLHRRCWQRRGLPVNGRGARTRPSGLSVFAGLGGDGHDNGSLQRRRRGGVGGLTPDWGPW